MGAILVSKNLETGRRIEIAYEIFYLIAEVFPKSNWKTLRLVSREFNEFAFGLPFFRKLCFRPHAQSNEAFQCVSMHPRWAKEVRTIVYNMTRTSRGPPPWMKSNFAYLALSRNANVEQPKESSPEPSKNRQNDDAQLLTPTEQLNVLTEGLKRLPAVSCFQISSQHIELEEDVVENDSSNTALHLPGDGVAEDPSSLIYHLGIIFSL